MTTNQSVSAETTWQWEHTLKNKKTMPLYTELLEFLEKRDCHYTQNCHIFRAQPRHERIRIVRRANLCTNCLRREHTSPTCRAGCVGYGKK
ncbi:PREDICTED: uncharacterized protein LOC108552423 [Eufriesea mexicana]|uniref:uncharacterized protein LOC108552423 n=1 Tax=Eufriesea mexicana TaxID=516756 RepID=UPI00083C6881|nr:PREDICTED: uncharacterized protein LOC108552423 [Eufriesea mexicana]